MSLIAFILLIVLLIEEYRFNATSKLLKKNYLLTLTWMSMLFLLIEEHKKREQDFTKLVKEMYENDSNFLNWQEFNKKWQTICESLKLSPRYSKTDNSLLELNDDMLEIIASKLYSNRVLFKKMQDSAKIAKAESENILNLPSLY